MAIRAKISTQQFKNCKFFAKKRKVFSESSYYDIISNTERFFREHSYTIKGGFIEL